VVVEDLDAVLAPRTVTRPTWPVDVASLAEQVGLLALPLQKPLVPRGISV
jgi:hypothetical protein